MNRLFICLITLASLSLATHSTFAGEGPSKDDRKPLVKTPASDALHQLIGAWQPVGEPQPGMPSGTLTFKSTSGDSAIVETMFPGSDHEMINMYTLGDTPTLTHYCAMGNQPRMKLKSFDKNVLTFEFVDGGNMKSRDEAHMDSVEMTIDGDKLVEKWSFYRDGKVVQTHTFEFKRQK